MGFRESKIEIIGFVGALALLFGVFTMLKGLGGSSQIKTENLVYEMPRPVNSDIESEFELGDREIIRNYIALEKKKALEKAKEEKNKKLAEAQKKAAAQGAKKFDSSNRKSQMTLQVVQAVNKRLAADHFKPSFAAGSQPTAAGKRAEVPTEESADGEDKEKKDVMSFEEWQQLLSSAPTQENMDKLILALREKEIEYKDFYRLIEGLLNKKEKEPQTAALYAIQMMPNVLSFSLLAKHLDNLTPENRQLGSTILLSYTQPNRLSILAQALRMNDFVVVKRAAEAITVGLDHAKNGQPIRDPRFARGEISNSSPVEPFQRFVPIFQQWKESGDNNLVGLAELFLSRWLS